MVLVAAVSVAMHLARDYTPSESLAAFHMALRATGARGDGSPIRTARRGQPEGSGGWRHERWWVCRGPEPAGRL